MLIQNMKAADVDANSISGELELIEKSISRLSVSVANHSDGIISVLMPEMKGGEVGGNTAPEPMRAPLTAKLRELRAHIDGISLRIESLTSRVSI